MEHFLPITNMDSSQNAAAWYYPRTVFPTQAQEFAIGSNSFQLIPISGANPVTTTSAAFVSSDSITHSIFRSQAGSLIGLQSVKEEVEENSMEGSKTPSPAASASPEDSGEKKTKEKWDTKRPCPVCGKVLSRGDKLKNHMRLHSDSLPHQCDVCGHGFMRSESLRVHGRVHTGERPYLCLVCGKTYTRKDKLTRHAIVHTGQRPFVCGDCGKSFTRKDKMQRHSLIHRVEKPFTCAPCNARFAREDLYNLHMDKKHDRPKYYQRLQTPQVDSSTVSTPQVGGQSGLPNQGQLEEGKHLGNVMNHTLPLSYLDLRHSASSLFALSH